MNEKPKKSNKQSEKKQLLENKGWKGFSYRWAITYLVLSSVNFIITFISPIFWLKDSLFYIFAMVCSIGMFGLIIYFFIKKKKEIKLVTLFFHIGGIFAILLVLYRWPKFLTASLAFFELIAIFLTFFKRKKIQPLEDEDSKIKKRPRSKPKSKKKVPPKKESKKKRAQ